MAVLCIFMTGRYSLTACLNVTTMSAETGTIVLPLLQAVLSLGAL